MIYLYPGWFGISVVAMPYFLLGILIICEITDIVDGFLARRKNQVTDVGKIIDPMADTITHISVFFTFTQGMVSMPLLLIFVLLYRELAISALRTLCALRGYALAARKSGKVKAILQAVACFLIVILMLLYTSGYISIDTLQTVSVIAVSVVALYTIVTLADYFYANREHIRKLVKS